ncbi:MAG: hypothetical protein ACSW8A_10315, partial [Lachnospiraceae bacterium]
MKIAYVRVAKAEISLNGRKFKGDVIRVPWREVEYLINTQMASNVRHEKDAETTADDVKRFASLGDVKAKVSIDLNNSKAISDKLIGIFFEDISYAADGGLYAELVQNRDFEYTSKDHRGWNATTAWHSSKPIEIATE